MVSLALPEPEEKLRQKLFSDWQLSPEQPFFLACSGGVDSTALLHAAHALALRVEVLHVNHHWHPDSARWAEHVATLAAGYGYPCRLLDLPAEQKGEGPEDRARRGRYALFAGQLQEGDWILSAQHRDDQAETLVLQLLRGAGSDGLAAMPERRRLGAGTLGRPFLELTRAALRQYLRQQGIRWLEDPANSDLRYARARLRQRIWPLFHELGWPQASASIARSAANIADQLAVEDAWYAQQAMRCWLGGAVGRVLSVDFVKEWAPALQRVFLRRWLRDLGANVPDRQSLERLRQLFGPSQGGRRVELADLRAWRQGQRVQLWQNGPRHTIPAQEWRPHAPCGRGAGFRWCWGQATGPAPGLSEGAVIVGGTELQGRTLRWSKRRAGARYRNVSGHQRPLKKFLLELGIPPFLRDDVPILWTDTEEILWIPDFYLRKPALPEKEVLWVDLIRTTANS
ncbi:tRNA lysidine(34) synthetase TilS [Igneacidithiobacillus copahuensis]|uniref:tRNA lysidine(34) synthetase TilS n=1 Tax=Igneacidithiobacillus copahuensis TaxID=2724909 RepID=UPI001C079F53|nr:tRNA lysidine(34) synthetase TilS [Igneacidithiobacillus copahuensis]MBU2757131.1 tRNA lysidine(34) synthetase TilS [Acidithiobacillus sp. BN09-2]